MAQDKLKQEVEKKNNLREAQVIEKKGNLINYKLKLFR
jgi:hypothetical protein